MASIKSLEKKPKNTHTIINIVVSLENGCKYTKIWLFDIKINNKNK